MNTIKITAHSLSSPIRFVVLVYGFIILVYNMILLDNVHRKCFTISIRDSNKTNINVYINEGSVVDAPHVDFSKVFDKIHHGRLTHKVRAH